MAINYNGTNNIKEVVYNSKDIKAIIFGSDVAWSKPLYIIPDIYGGTMSGIAVETAGGVSEPSPNNTAWGSRFSGTLSNGVSAKAYGRAAFGPGNCRGTPG
mgnify:CR=1 FL=1